MAEDSGLTTIAGNSPSRTEEDALVQEYVEMATHHHVPLNDETHEQRAHRALRNGGWWELKRLVNQLWGK